jgi:tRNA uridine 5-carbamoylmethylation protein Kti12
MYAQACRQQLLQQVQLLLQDAPAEQQQQQQQQTNKNTSQQQRQQQQQQLVVVDDNNFYQSMRYQLLQLARTRELLHTKCMLCIVGRKAREGVCVCENTAYLHIDPKCFSLPEALTKLHDAPQLGVRQGA